MRLFPSPDIGPFGRRQRHERGSRIPLTVSRRPSTSDNDRIVIDTFGADDVAALPGGCACCTVRAKLQGALRGVSAEREQRPFSRVVIESAEDLGPTLRTFMSDRALAAEFYVEGAPPLDGTRFTLTENAPLTWDAFSHFTTTLTVLRGPDLLQMKGLLDIDGCVGPVAVQVMGHLAAQPVELQAWASDERTSRLEFITRNIDERMVRELFDSVRTLSSPSP